MYPMYPGMYLSCIDSSEEWTLELLMCPLLARVDIVGEYNGSNHKTCRLRGRPQLGGSASERDG